MTAMKANELSGQHRDLAIDLDRMHLLCVAPDNSLPDARMRPVLERELRDLRAQLELHFGFEEKGPYAERASASVDQLHAQHAEILTRVDALASAVATVDLGRLRADIADLLDLVGEHERSEAGVLGDEA